MRAHLQRLALIAALVVVAHLCPPAAGAESIDGPDYAAAASWLLPWPSGEAYRVTWGPKDHWTHGKATGLAYDFALPEGVPVYAPADGTARYAVDDRPLETTLGNYADLQTAGGWMIRLAHLRDYRVETREIVAGELLGYAGSSGVSASHLHLELFVKQEGTWRCPDPAQLTELFGRPVTDFEPGALIVNGGCTGMLVGDGEARTLASTFNLGDSALLLVPLRNEGKRPIDVLELQIVLESPLGEAVLVDAEGPWRFPARGLRTLAVHVRPDLAGVWQVQGARYTTAEQTCEVTLAGRLLVEALPVTLASLDLVSTPKTGTPLEVAVTLRHTGDEPLRADGLLIWGQTPSGGRWQATLGHPVLLEAARQTELLARDGPVLDQVGSWQTSGVALVRDGFAYRIAFCDKAMMVSGPQLVMESIEVYPLGTGPMVLARVANVGDAEARDVLLEIWGWHGDANGKAGSGRAAVSLEPGRSAVVRLAIPPSTGPSTWRVAGAGYWLEERYIPMALPAAPSLAPAATAGAER